MVTGTKTEDEVRLSLEVVVAPAVTVVQVVAPRICCCHVTVGAGAPHAAAENVAVAPSTTWDVMGWSVMTGASGAPDATYEYNPGVVICVPALLVNTAM